MDDIIYDEDPGMMQGTGNGHGFADMYFNEGCLGPNCNLCTTGPIWVRADYLVWWRSGLDLPALVTTAPDGTPLATAGELGQSSTTTLFGNDNERYPARPGGRVEAGLWLDQCECWAVGGRFYWLGDATLNYNNSSTGSPILAIPFTEGQDGSQDARLLSYPGTFNGSMNATATSEVFGGDAYLRAQWCQTSWGRVDLLGGYQFARINEGFVMNSTAADFGGASNQLSDTFDTKNEFHGGVLGLMAHVDHCWWYVDALAKVGLGNMHQTVDISGRSVSTVGGTTSVINNSGLFAQPTNVGTHSRNQFTAIPEVGVNVGWHVTNCLDVNFGYTLIVFTGVVRPGDAIDTTVNTSQIGGALTGAARPAFNFTDNDLVVHGLNMGLTFKW
jgi:hypothetical protein